MRAKIFNEMKGNFGTMFLDKETEDFINISIPSKRPRSTSSASPGTHGLAVSGVPIIKLLGIQPAGLNASSAGELRAFADTIHSYQESFFRPNLETVLRLVQLSIFGEVDPDIGFDFEPLTEELDELERAQATAQGVGSIVSAFESGLLDRPTALKEMRSFAEAIGTSSEISDQIITEAENEPPTPSAEELTAQAAMVRAEGELVQ